MGKTYKILVADDNELMLDLLAMEIREFISAVELTLVGDGRVAQEHAESTSFDLIISDNVMPGKLGSALLREIRDGRGPNQRTPFILCSGNYWMDEIKGIRDCLLLQKPFDMKKLQTILDKIFLR